MLQPRACAGHGQGLDDVNSVRQSPDSLRVTARALDRLGPVVFVFDLTTRVVVRDQRIAEDVESSDLIPAGGG